MSIHPPLDPRSLHRRFEVRVPDEMRYAVDLTHGLLDRHNPLLADTCAGRQALVFVSPTIDALYGRALRDYLAHHLPAGQWQLRVQATGEERKTLASVEAICAAAKDFRLDRHGLLIAVGGGILCDLVGFAASIYKRGIRFVKVNTTLVGQVDVGVGIKTGANFLASKNLLGSYYPAYASINDPAFLHTLPLRQISCGLAEIIKMALILSPALFELLERHVDSMLCRRFVATQRHEAETDQRILSLAMTLMMDELRPNLREHNLQRLVDFGHSFSPTIETASGHRILHGEAVAIDMALSTLIAHELGHLALHDAHRVLDLLLACDLPLFDAATCQLPLMEQALDDMRVHRGGAINLVIPTALGGADFLVQRDELPSPMLARALHQLASYRPRHRWAAALAA